MEEAKTRPVSDRIHQINGSLRKEEDLWTWKLENDLQRDECARQAYEEIQGGLL